MDVRRMMRPGAMDGTPQAQATEAAAKASARQGVGWAGADHRFAVAALNRFRAEYVLRYIASAATHHIVLSILSRATSKQRIVCWADKMGLRPRGAMRNARGWMDDLARTRCRLGELSYAPGVVPAKRRLGVRAAAASEPLLATRASGEGQTGRKRQHCYGDRITIEYCISAECLLSSRW